MYEGTKNANERVGGEEQRCDGGGQGSVVERLSKYGIQVMGSAPQRRMVLQRQQEITERFVSAQKEAPERASVTSATRKKHFKELLLKDKSHSAFGSVLSSQTTSEAPCEAQDASWALYPMEHAWMLSAVEGNYDTLLEFISDDPQLLTRRDFISGYTVLHWLAKKGRDDTMLKILIYAQDLNLCVNVNVRGSGGLTPLHVASMHSHYMVIKLLVGAFSANVDAMDYNGKRAWQYLKTDAPQEMKELLGTWDDHHRSGLRRFSEVEPVSLDELQSDAQESCAFERTRSRSSWRGSVRKLLKSFSGNAHM